MIDDLPPAPSAFRPPPFDLPSDRPVRLRVTPFGIKLAYYHPTKPIPPFKVNFPREQWEQMVALVAGVPAGRTRFEAYVGFTEESLALHRIDAVEQGAIGAGAGGGPAAARPAPEEPGREGA